MKQQDELEEELLTAALFSHFEILRSRQYEILLALLALLLTCGAVYLAPKLWRLDEFLSVTSCGAKDQALAHKCDDAPAVGAYGIRGRRATMEDRIVSRVVKVEGGAVAINAVLDGHGGEVS